MKTLLSFFRNLSVSLKFASTYFGILLIEIIFTAVYLYVQTSNTSIKQASLLMEQNILQAKESILQKQNLIESEAANIIYDSDVQNFLDTKFENRIQQLEEYQFQISPIIEHVIKLNNNINSMMLYMSDNVVTEKAYSFYSVNELSDSNFYKQLVSEKKVKDGWISTHKENYYVNSNEETNSDQVLTFSKKIISKNTYQDIGLLSIDIKESVIFNMLRNPIVTKFGRVFIVDGNNTIISDNISELFKKNISETGISKFSVHDKINRIQKVNGVNSLLISIPIDELGFNIIGIFPTSHFNNNVNKNFEKTVAVLIFFSILIGIIIYITTSALLARIKILVKAMKQVREGNLNVSVEVKSKDEFGQLGSTFNHMTSRIHELIETVYKIKLIEKETELKILQAQINPHFLYNTLATISWTARKVKSPEIEKISNSLAKFYRLVLSKGRNEITAKEEIEMVKAYLNIQKIRFEDMFDVVYDIDEEVYNHKMIKSVLQPLVENALNHGIEPKRSHGTIIVKANMLQDKLCFKIIDDGVGTTNEVLKEVLSGQVTGARESGYAVKNIMERLKAYYGTSSSFEIYSKPGIGTVVRIVMKSL
ncbi:sensor histidine kinase [Clostridium sp. 19966]|uniref:sensor histidine kinase n=1 Tax=Clostridium sp. 19966 TaxID=2768166 RepID=UPI0028DFA396|nr:sensor histidine kinase [Clostridium sp. 19966]MDT8717371.1 sensor histidine kinase [Clostridium sp. 19966]